MNCTIRTAKSFAGLWLPSILQPLFRHLAHDTMKQFADTSHAVGNAQVLVGTKFPSSRLAHVKPPTRSPVVEPPCRGFPDLPLSTSKWHSPRQQVVSPAACRRSPAPFRHPPAPRPLSVSRRQASNADPKSQPKAGCGVQRRAGRSLCISDHLKRA